MNFQTKLNELIETIGCNSKELSNTSNISTSVISRYRSGERTPKHNSDKFNKLIDGLSILAKKNNIKKLNKKKITDLLESTLYKENIDIELFKNNLNILINTLNINVSEMAKYIGFDSSYISKIRNGKRQPQNIYEFSLAICKYIINKYNDTNSIIIIEQLINKKIDNNNYLNILHNWICNNINEENNIIDSFLTKLDEFNLNEFIKETNFDKIKIPTIPLQLPKYKTYYKLEGFKESQLDIFKAIALSKNSKEILFYSNMPLLDASKDIEFSKKFMVGLAIILKKGIHLNMIHNLDRPFKEIILGLEGWIPLYMTGQISPYYFKENTGKLYSNIECISDNIALSGTCIANNINTTRIIVTNKQEDINYYKENAKVLLKRANNLMNIYDYNNKEKYYELLNNNTLINKNRRNILTTLPNYTISNKLLNQILNNNNLNENDKNIIIDYINKEKNRTNKIIKNNIIIDEINILTKEEFNDYYLSTSNIFINTKIKYTYKDYLEHLKLTKEYAKNNSNYKLKINNKNIFKNINIHIINNTQVIISKEKNPNIHFVIYHPILINAIESFK